MKYVHFDDYSATGIRQSVEKVYPQLKNEVWGFFKCESVPGSLKLVAANEPRSINEIKR
jgi:hypothetical protein